MRSVCQALQAAGRFEEASAAAEQSYNAGGQVRLAVFLTAASWSLVALSQSPVDTASLYSSCTAFSAGAGTTGVGRGSLAPV